MSTNQKLTSLIGKDVTLKNPVQYSSSSAKVYAGREGKLLEVVRGSEGEALMVRMCLTDEIKGEQHLWFHALDVLLPKEEASASKTDAAEHVYYKVVDAMNWERELQDDGTSSHYDWKKGTPFKEKHYAFELARQNAGVVVEVSEKVIGGWRFQEHDGRLTDKKYEI